MLEEMFLDLVEQHQAQIYHYAFCLLNNQEDAKDVTEETFIKAWNFDAELRLETVRSWLIKCANNLCIDLLRRRRFQVPLTTGDTEEIEMLAHYQHAGTASESSHSSPEECCIRRERQQLVQQAIAQLPLHFRTVVMLHEIHELSFEEIAETLNQPIGTVKSNMFRAKKRLREILGSSMGRGIAEAAYKDYSPCSGGRLNLTDYGTEIRVGGSHLTECQRILKSARGFGMNVKVLT